MKPSLVNRDNCTFSLHLSGCFDLILWGGQLINSRPVLESKTTVLRNRFRKIRYAIRGSLVE